MYKRLVALIGNIIAASAIIIAALIARQSVKRYREQRAIDRKEEVTKRQREEYERYLTAFWDVQRFAHTEHHQQALAIYQTARDNLLFYASDEGLLRVNKFHKYIVDRPTNDERDEDEVKTLYARMVIALRKDCYGKTDLTVDQIKPSNPSIERIDTPRRSVQS